MFRRIPLMWRVTGSLLVSLAVVVSTVRGVTQAVRTDYSCLHEQSALGTRIIDVMSGEIMYYRLFRKTWQISDVVDVIKGFRPTDDSWVVRVSTGPPRGSYSEALIFKDKRTLHEQGYNIDPSVYSISPNGKYLVYRISKTANESIFQVEALNNPIETVTIGSSFWLESNVRYPIVMTIPFQHNSTPFLVWSPDSRYLAVYSTNNIALADVQTATLKRLVSNHRFPTYANQPGEPIFWTSDRSRLIYLGWKRNVGTHLLAYDPATGETTTLAEHIWQMYSRSPDSNYTIVRYRRDNYRSDVVLINLVTAKTTTIRPNAPPLGGLNIIFWQDDRVLMVYPDRLVAWVYMDGTGYGQVDISAHYFSRGRLDGNRFYYEGIGLDNEMYVIAIDLSTKTQQVISKGKDAWESDISPDSKKAALYTSVSITSNRLQNTMTIQDIASGASSTFEYEGMPIRPFVWAPDSTKLYVGHGDSYRSTLYSVLDVDAKLLRDVSSHASTALPEERPTWSRCDND